MRYQPDETSDVRCRPDTRTPFVWRKKWEKVWDEVRYCSDRCRSDKRKASAS
ncbi:MAG: DUF2256 domain-containing protein [Marivivens sp.]|nr:DUF2256 domain-containing protein [Marivivens sp.]